MRKMMGSDDGAASVSTDGDGDNAASASCHFLKCVLSKDKDPVYLEVSEACGFVTAEPTGFLGDEESDAAAAVAADVVEEKGRMSAKQDESGNWIVQWNVRRQQEGDFIALCFVGKLIFKNI